MDLTKFIANVPDFPKKGIQYKDIQPLLQNARAFEDAINAMVDLISVPLDKIDYVVGIESRGFIFGTALSWITNSGFKMIRKAGKLPNVDLVSMEYGLEYGRDTIEMKKGAGNVVIVDDVYATGGTISAASTLCDLAGYTVVDKICLLDIQIAPNLDVKCVLNNEDFR